MADPYAEFAAPAASDPYAEFATPVPADTSTPKPGPGILAQAGSALASQLGIDATPEEVASAGKHLGAGLLDVAKSTPEALATAQFLPVKKGVGAIKEALRYHRTGQLPDEKQHFKEQGEGANPYSLPYRVLTPVAENIGVNVRGMEQAAAEGDRGGVVGEAAVVPATMAITEGVSGLSKVGDLRRAAAERVQPLARKVVGAERALKDEVGKSAEAHTEHLKELQRVHEENAGTEQVRGIRNKEEAELKAKTDEYFAKEDEVKGKVKAENDKNWDAWRKKVADTAVDMQPVRDTIERVSADFPEVKQIIKSTTPTEADLSAINQQYVSDRRGLMQQQGYGTDFDSLSPDRKLQVESLMERMGLAPEGGNIAIDGTKPMSMSQLHELKTQIGWKVFRHEYPPNVTGAMKQVYKSLEQAEARGSIESDALGELEAARRSHAEFQEAFGRSKPKRAMEGELRKKEANPQAYREQEEADRLNHVAKHDPDLAEMSKDIKTRREQIKRLPTEEQLRKSLKQPPPAPEAVDAGKVAREAIAKRAQNWGTFNARDVGILSSGVIGEFLGSLFGSGSLDRVLGAVTGVGAYEGGKFAASRALNKPAVIDWLAKTPPAEIEALSKIPGADRVKIVDGLTDIAKASAKSGRPVVLSPQVRRLLGPEKVAGILTASGRKPVQNRKEALELLHQ